MAKIGGLGKGMDALFEDNKLEIQPKQMVRLSELEPNKAQPRKDFDESAIAALAESIRQNGILQPLLVRPLPSGGYQIVAGERRWRACRMLGLDEVPVYIREMDDAQVLQVGLIENLQRENLNPIEEAMGYRELMESYGMTQEQVAKIVGRSRSAVANALRSLSLPDEVQNMLRKGEITPGHAKVLAGINDTEHLISLAKKAAKDQITVRQIEKACKKQDAPVAPPEEPEYIDPRDSFFTEMQIGLAEHLGRKVEVTWNGNRGMLAMEFYDKEDLIAIVQQIASL